MIVVELAASLTGEHKALVLRYLGTAERFSLAEWVTLLEAFTMLSDSTVQLQGVTLTLQAFYDRFIDQVYGDACIAELLAATEISVSAPAIQARYARQLYQQLRREPFMLGDTPATESLLAYCLYWWASFVRGYAFEIAIFRDLDAARIHYTAHDLRVREQRFSPCDLTVLGMTGDVKTTTYFLYVARSFPLTCDFYITRLYNTAMGRYIRIVVLTDEAWHRINGDIVHSDLARVAQWLPQVSAPTTASRRRHAMMRDYLDEQFEAYLARDDDALIGSQFFETLAEIERRRAQETIEVTLRLVNGRAQFEPSDHIRTQGNTLWVGDKRIVVKMVE